MKSDILEAIYQANLRGEVAALVLLIENKGSTPGEDSSAMAVFADGSIMGTVGGGKIEADILRRTKEALISKEDYEFDYNLSKNGELKMSCGGNSRGYVKIFSPKKRLIIFGAGHVGQKLARISTKTGFAVDVIDDRAEFKVSPDFKDVDNYYDMPITDVIDKLSFNKEDTFIVLCTRGHATDQEILEHILKKDYKYLGMIGSKAKVKDVFTNLKAKGFTDESLNKVYTPIGLDIDNGSVEEIAISIMAEILMVKNAKDGRVQKASI